MEKQMKEETTMEENKKKNPDSERKSKLVSAILMAFVCVVMMGGGTYAWFTMSNTAKVTSLKLKVASEGKLYISNDSASNFTQDAYKVSSAEWPDKDNVKVLYPCTTTDGIEMKKPFYKSETEVTAASDITESAEKAQYYLEQDFYLYMDEGEVTTPSTYTVHLTQKTGESDSKDGTYFESNSVEPKPEYCVRISLAKAASVDATATSAEIYEPNYDGLHTGNVTSATSALQEQKGAHRQKTTGVFVDSVGTATATGDSDSLFEIQGNTKTKVTIRVWFEGTDPQCCNNIDLKEITAQLKFKANKKITDTGNNGD